MKVFLNGKFLPESRATISVFDRGFLYGDGLFEALRVFNGRMFRWEQHMERLQRGAKFLNLRLPYSRRKLAEAANRLIALNRFSDGLARITVSRGVGVRGYSPRGAEKSTLVISLHPLPPPAGNGNPPAWRLITAARRLPANEPVAQFKTCNKLPQILARAEADACGADDALLMNTDGHVVEGSSSNLFWIQNNKVFTPPLAGGVLAGVTRTVLFELCGRLKIKSGEALITPKQLRAADGVFLSLSSFGVVEAIALDGSRLRRSPIVARLREAYESLLARETGGAEG